MLKKIFIGFLVMAMFAALILSACTPESALPEEEAPSAEAIELNFASFDPGVHWKTGLMEWFAEELENRTDGMVKTTIYTDGALGGPMEIADNIISGVADMGFVLPSFIPGHVPAAGVMDIPLLMPSIAAVEYVGWDLYYSGYLNVEGAKLIAVTGSEGGTLMLGEKKVTTVEDFKGLNLFNPGDWAAASQKLEFNVVPLPPPEIYSAFERGLVDGGMAGIALPLSLNMEGMLKYVVRGKWGNTSTLILMNIDKWNSLPSDVQVVVAELGREMNCRWTDLTFEAETSGFQAFEDAGAEVYSLSPEEWSRLEAILAPLPDEWASEMDAQGLPGTEVKDIVLRSLQKMGY